MLEHLSAQRGPDGSLTREAARQVALGEGMPPAALIGATSYYAELGLGRKGARHVRVCGGTACFAACGGAHLGEVEHALGVHRGECREDGAVSLDEVRCIGCCYGGPAALDGDKRVAGHDLAKQLAEKAEPQDPPIPVRAAVERPVVLAGLVAGERAWSVWPALADAADGAELVLAAVEASGLRGRGGAGFPVAAKWRAALAHPAPRVVVVNGDEGDPGSFADRLLLEQDPGRVLEGLALAGLACGASRGLIYVRSEYPAAQEAVRRAVDSARDAGLLGGETGFAVEVVSGHGSYVAGEETGVIHALEGLRGSVKARPPYPTERGWLGYPTVVNNVETLAAVPWIVEHGGDSYAALGTPEEPGTKLLSLSERFSKPGVVEVEIGVPLREVVEELGGGLRDGAQLRAVQVGGPLGGVIGPVDLEVPMSSLGLSSVGAALGHGGVVGFDERIAGEDLVHHLWSFAAAESCGACSPCRVGSRRGVELARRAARGEDGGEQDALCEVLAEASLCAFGRAVPAAVGSAMRAYGLPRSR